MTKKNDYFKELEFSKNCLDYYKIHHQIYSINDEVPSYSTFGIRHTLELPHQSLANLRNLFKQNLRENTLCYLTDEFFCHYAVFVLPETSPTQFFMVGPYIAADEKETLSEFIKHTSIAPPWLPILSEYYFKICRLPNEDVLNVLLYALADSIWGKGNYSIEHHLNGLPETLSTLMTAPEPQYRLDIFSDMETIERVYSGENELMNAVSHGQSTKAKTILTNIPLSGFKYEAEPLRNLKNFSVIINTLFRKAAEQGGVHPLYIDQLSSSFLTRIEEITRSDNIFDLWTDMIQKYCSLVNNHTTRDYSLPIQKVITRINYDISADLSLKTTAEFLNVNASYLSNLFRKETGYTLTNYVNKKRMEHAAFLLSSTALPISSIAQQCGILDDNYFTKLFKKQYQVTPSQFRDSIYK